ncbi:dihydrofolate reductase [Planctomonas sp. JC2975]|uniref:dihydrofolate reductase family protein n=1 Tax=Planctomonas sp. JC2975 TaxID=2729626 RepID=UPI001474507B|nr:dihydrofolate reductase family protein [Planctomonas sp. JC2975]NNC10640.1 dihydrofolate reductase [Planctomonas sp. JC2975]
MTRFRYYVASSLDGFIADRDNRIDWLTSRETGVEPDDTAEAGIPAFIAGIGAVVMGASTYEFLLGLDPDADWGYTVPAWVLTHRDLPIVAGHDVRFHSGDVAAIVDDLVATAGDLDVWLVGGGDLVAQFAAIGRLDEIEVTIIPIVLGAGAPLLAAREHLDLRLADSAAHGDGTVSLRYEVPVRS